MKTPGSASAHSHLVRACVQLLEHHGIPAAAINQRPVRRADGSYRTPGAPPGFGDIVACVPTQGRMLMIECKTGKSGIRPDQVAAARKWSNAGCYWGVARSVDDVMRMLHELNDEEGGGPSAKAR